MQAEVVSGEGGELEGLSRGIEAWRQMRPKSRSMPEELWSQASAAAHRLGVGRVSKVLGLGYEALKRRVIPSGAGLQEASGQHTGEAPTQFIELSGLATRNDSGNDQMVVEVVAADGARLTIRLKGSGVNVGALVGAFRGHP